MRDIVERLELQAFVADKIQSGMKPLIMDCLDEITRLRAENENLREELNGQIASSKQLRDFIVQYSQRYGRMREALKPFAYYASQIPEDVSNTASASGTVGDLRAAAAAMRESGDNSQ